MKHTVSCQRAVIDHNGSPAHQLEHIQEGKEDSALFPEAHFYSFHSTAARFAADHACKEKHGAAYKMSDNNGKKPFLKAQRGKASSCEDFCQGNACAEPDQAVFEDGGTFFGHVSCPPWLM